MRKKNGEPAPIFAIGDVHGCADELDQLLGKLPLRPGCTVVFLGDYIDRGPKSRQVVDRILALAKEHNVVALLGNHESMLLEYLDGRDAQRVARFVLNGGSATLATYADENGVCEMPTSHVEFFQNLRISHDTPTHFFVHAGVPNVLLADLDQAEYREEMIWVRKNFHRSTFRWEKLIVHGHSPVPTVEIAAHRINLDTGCVYQGSLSAMEFPSHRIYSVERRMGPERTLLHDATKRAAVRFHGAIPVELDVNGTLAAFETVDYSEIGLGIRARDPARAPKLRLGSKVVGTVGPSGLFQISFTGKVVRTASLDGRDVYGLTVELSLLNG